jgi:S1-C subfamily serine protease
VRLRRLAVLARGAVPFASGVMAALAALIIYNAITAEPPPLTLREVRDTVGEVMASATPPPANSTMAFRAIQPSLVLIQSKGKDTQGDPGSALGTGVVISDAAEILTSLHVVEGASEIEVIFADGTHAKAFIAAEQPENDIAVLMPDRLPGLLVPAVLGNPNALRVGDEAFVAGNPFGLYGSFSAGVISGFERSFESPRSEQPLDGLIQIDTAVNPGNSGGPLVNRYGQVVGIVVGILNPTGQEVFIGIGFAVPIDVAGGAAGLPPY